MSKSKVKAAAPAVVDALAAHYVPGKYRPRPNTKNGINGTQGTFAAICEAYAAANAPLPLSVVTAICKAQNDPMWVRYGIRKGYIVATQPVA